MYGWRRIQTPGFEDTALFARTSGEASDVVHKEMYSFADRSDRPLTLRPEGTAPIARAYVEHGLHREPQPVKAYTIAPMYRYGAPGRGRYREHYQLSVEAIGSADPSIDAEIIQLYHELLRRLGVTQVGAAPELDRRRELPPAVRRAKLNAWLDAHADVLDEDARHKRATSPLQVFDVKNPTVRAALEDAPKIGESLCDECREHFDAVQRALDAYGVPYMLDATLVRGLDYYTRTTFEFIGPDENANSTICGGGRYDGLVEADRRPADAGHRLRRGYRAAAARARERGRSRLRLEPLDVFFVRRRGRGAAARRCRYSPSCAVRASSADTRLRRSLAEGAADAGGPNAGAGDGDRGRRRRRRSAVRGVPTRRSDLAELVARLTAA